MSLEMFLAERISNTGHHPTHENAIRGLTDPDEEVRRLSRITVDALLDSAAIGMQILDDVEILPTEQITDTDLCALLLEYYARDGWQETEESDRQWGLHLTREKPESRDHLSVVFSNDSENAQDKIIPDSLRRITVTSKIQHQTTDVRA